MSSHEAGWSRLFNLESLARFAVTHVLLRIRIVSWPVVAQCDSGKRLLSPKLFNVGIVVAFPQHLETILFSYYQLSGISVVDEGSLYLLVRPVTVQIAGYELVSRVIVRLLLNLGALLLILRVLGVRESGHRDHFWAILFLIHPGERVGHVV